MMIDEDVKGPCREAAITSVSKTEAPIGESDSNNSVRADPNPFGQVVHIRLGHCHECPILGPFLIVFNLHKSQSGKS